MKITFNEIPVPYMTSFEMFAKLDKELLKTEKKIQVTASAISKTRVTTSMQLGNCMMGINLPVAGYKTDYKTEWNYFSGNRTESNYFKKSKTQDKAAYLKYLEDLLQIVFKDHLYLELDELQVDFLDRTFK